LERTLTYTQPGIYTIKILATRGHLTSNEIRKTVTVGKNELTADIWVGGQPDADIVDIRSGSVKNINWDTRNADVCTITKFDSANPKGAPTGWWKENGRAATSTGPLTLHNTTYKLACFQEEYVGKNQNASAQVILHIPSVQVGLAANPTTSPSCVDSAATVLTASVVGGDAEGTVNYHLWWNCNSTSTSISEVIGECGRLPVPPEGSKCTSNEIGRRCLDMGGTTMTTPHRYTGAGVYHPKVIVERGLADNAQARTSFTVLARPTLGVTLRTVPTMGTAPLNDVDLVADVTGSAAGTINYKLYCNWNGDDTDWRNAATSRQVNGTTTDPLRVNDLCDYPDPGTYYPKVVVERDCALPAENHVPVVVSESPNPPLSVACDYNGEGGAGDKNIVVGEKVDLKATVTGTAAGPIEYAFYCHKGSDSTEITDDHALHIASTSVNPYTAQDLCTYGQAGDKLPKIIVKKGGESAVAHCAIVVIPPPQPPLSVDLTPNSITGSAPLEASFTSTASGTAVGTVNHNLWWNCSSTATSTAVVEATCGRLPRPVALGRCASNSVGKKCDGFGTVMNATVTYQTPGPRTAKVIVERDAVPNAQDRSTVTVSAGPTLSVDLTPNTLSGNAPLSGTFTARVTGTATGTVNYYFWKKCSSASTSKNTLMSQCPGLPADGEVPNNGCISNTVGTRCNGMGQERVFTRTYGTADNCTVANPCYAKVLVERDAVPNAQDRSTVTVSAGPTLSVDLTPNTLSGNAPLSGTFTARVTGTATGTVNYYFWKKCSSASTSKNTLMSQCPGLPADGEVPNNGCISNTVGTRCNGVGQERVFTRTYGTADNCTVANPCYAKVLVERDAVPNAQDRSTVTVNAGPTLSVDLTPNTLSGNAPYSPSLTANVTGSATGTVNYYFWKNCDKTTTDKNTLLSAPPTGCGNLTAPTSGGCISTPNVGFRCSGVGAAAGNQSRTTSFRYADAGSYTAKVMVERDAAPNDEDRTPVTANLPSAGPTVTISAAPARVGELGKSTKLTWNASADAVDCRTLADDDWGGTKTPDDEQWIAVNKNPSRYGLECKNAAGTYGSPDSVSVGLEPDGGTCSVVLTTTKQGDGANIHWETGNVVGCEFRSSSTPPDPDWDQWNQVESGAPSEGNQVVNPPEGQRPVWYALNCGCEDETVVDPESEPSECKSSLCSCQTPACTSPAGIYASGEAVWPGIPSIQEINPGSARFNIFQFFRGLVSGLVTKTLAR
jgi:PKD repeat protein